tara:strand:- start:2159 stop:3712 length:1554 start_codon:yes stop_codon:yes gene_type:complete
MVKSTQLTWQKGIDKRAGRWKKKYRGKTYYFNGGRGKSDRDAHSDAFKQWELTKLRIDAILPRKHQLEYESIISTWEQVLDWSSRHGDSEMAQAAFEKMEKLRAALKAPILKSPRPEDYFESFFTVPVIELPENLSQQTALDLKNSDIKFSFSNYSDQESRKRYSQELDGSQQRFNREIWHDRLESSQKRSVITQDSVSTYIDEFIKHKQQEYDSEKISLGRLSLIQHHLRHFRENLEEDIPVSEINAKILLRYQSALVENIKKGKWKKSTSRPYLVTVKSFVRWLWHIEVLDSLPRIMDSKSDLLSIRIDPEKIVEFTDSEIELLLNGTEGRTKLFVLLMLNCGMTQKDISDLQKDEVDLSAGRIIRKRSKTANFAGVPTVNYLLWPETLQLLKQYQDDSGSDCFFLNSKGARLLTEYFNTRNNYAKNDNIKNAYERVKRKLGLKKPLKSLKKTSASRLRNNMYYNGVVDLYLGHAPQKISERHYASPPQELFDAAISWLAEEYKLEPPIVNTSSN